MILREEICWPLATIAKDYVVSEVSEASEAMLVEVLADEGCDVDWDTNWEDEVEADSADGDIGRFMAGAFIVRWSGALIVVLEGLVDIAEE